MAKQISILALNNSFASSLMGFVDIFESANRAARHLWQVEENSFDLKVYSINGEPIRCANGLRVYAEGAIPHKAPSHLHDQTLIIIPTMLDNPLHDNEQHHANAQHIQWLRRHHQHFNTIVTHCSGTFALAAAGLLDNSEATTAWWLARKFMRQYPKVTLRPEQRVVESGRFLIGGASGCYRDTAMKLVQKHCGSEISRALSKFLLIDKADGNQNTYAMQLPAQTNNVAVQKALQYIMDNLERTLRIEDIASKAAVTSRTLGRYFHQEFACSPQQYIQQMRVEKSKVLLESTALKLPDIASRCGYTDENAFRRLFKRHCKLSPNAFRREFSA